MKSTTPTPDTMWFRHGKPVYGLLQLSDGTEVDLEGPDMYIEGEEVDPSEIDFNTIMGYGEDQLGSEANIYVEARRPFEIRGRQCIRDFFVDVYCS